MHDCAISPTWKTKTVLQDLMMNLSSSTYLPYDRNRRWRQNKNHLSVLAGVLQTDAYTAVLITTNSDQPRLNVYLYAQSIETDVTQALENISHTYLGLPTRIYSQYPLPGYKLSMFRLTMTYTVHPEITVISTLSDVRRYDELSQQTKFTLRQLGNHPDNKGFSFLAEYMRHSGTSDPVFVIVDDQQIVGAIGPLTLANGPARDTFLLPVYFGVHHQFRNRGLGTTLWQAAMNWGHSHHADHHSFQTEINSYAATFYADLGLLKTGTVYESRILN